MNILIPMAGLGTRFPIDIYKKPKPLIEINSIPMILRAIQSLDLDGTYLFIIRKSEFSEELKKHLNSIENKTHIEEIDYSTEGPASSSLILSNFINSNEELIIANCDQIMEWDSKVFLHNARLYDGLIVTYYANTNKNSYAKLNHIGQVVEIREKEVISSTSLNGIHYWKQGSLFVQSAKEMISVNDRARNGEFYIGPTYNYLIKKRYNIGVYHIPNEMHHAVGDPDDYDKFIKYEKNKTK
tara:strand:- start:5275 stop:5997 length:723 start_codon:yes stop_codon:yes gene_type:complete